MTRVVLDTNILVSGAYDDLSACWQIMEACTRGELTAVVSKELEGEYRTILDRKVNIRDYRSRVANFLSAAERVTPILKPDVVPEDPEDVKVLAAALAGKADAILTNDRHLLELDPYKTSYGMLRVFRPTAFLQLRGEESGQSWAQLATFLGLSK